MKNNNLVKFGLTVLASAVLAACSSSGGSSAPQEDPAAKAAAEAAAAKAAADAAAAKAAADKEAARQTSLKGTNDVGAKFVKKTDSNLVVGNGSQKDSSSSKSITNMTVDLHPSLDTVVVGIPLDGSKPQIYLEDFDFRGNTTNTSGKHTLSHIYRTADGYTKDQGADRANGETDTKTAKKGKQDDGLVYVFENGRLNYTHKTEGSDVIDTKEARNEDRLRLSVAEVYGHRTFLNGNSEEKHADGLAGEDTTVENAPFTAKAQDSDKYYTAGSKLAYVQYGRVTSKLNEVDVNKLEDGRPVVQLGTKVASYAFHGIPGSEDHYFYRGVNSTAYNGDLAGHLQGIYYAPNAEKGTLSYRGHAVTYNLDRNYTHDGKVPNAVGAVYKLSSGTHVDAEIKLATGTVTGELYNVWSKSVAGNPAENIKVSLATFDGKLENNGSLVGSSTRAFDSAKGAFTGSLFGANATELGGAIASTATEADKNWGASFGAKLQNKAYQPIADQPNAPELSESTDDNNAGGPNN